MEVDAAAAYEAALPDDPRVQRKQMFGRPAAFVNRQMFFGTFDGGLACRVGEARAAALAKEPGARLFEPTPGQAWPDYVWVPASTDPAALRALAAEAMRWSENLPKHKPLRDKSAR